MTFGVRMNKGQRHEYIVQRARELAATGKYLNYMVIEAVLTSSEDLPGARHVLDSAWLREELNQICAKARKGAENAD